MQSAALIESLRQFFASRGEDLACVYLFGSQARGTAGPASDVDLGVLRNGVPVCERDRSARIRFEVQAHNAYFDLLPYLREYRRAVRQSLR